MLELYILADILGVFLFFPKRDSDLHRWYTVSTIPVA